MNNLQQLRRATITITIGWICLILAATAWDVWGEYKQHIITIPQNAARFSFSRNTYLRLWFASHGGIYVPVTDSTPPNPYLSHIADRDIMTPSGKQLTLMNPAYAIRHFAEFAQNMETKWHITSLNLLNPHNAPDPWEKKALEEFEHGSQEVVEIAEFNGTPHLRLMRPLLYTAECQKCHGHMGYEQGDVRGGVGAYFSLEQSYKNFHTISRTLITTYLIVLSAGLIVIGFFFAKQKKSIQETAKLEAEQQRITESLQKREAQLTASQSVAKLGNWDLNLITQKLEWSDETYKLFDKNQEEFIPSFEAFSRLVHPDDLEIMQTEFQAALHSDTHPYHIEVRIINDTGRTWVMEAFGKVCREQDGNATRIFGTAQDVTERRKAADKLQQEKEISQAYLDVAAILIVVIDRDQKITVINKKGCEILGYDEAELLGKNWFEIALPAQSRKKVQEIFNKIISGMVETVAYFENSVITRDGKERLIAWHNSYVTDRHGTIVATVCSGEDITDRRKMEEDLEASKNELEQRVMERTIELKTTHQQLLHAEKLSAVGKLSASIAHEFNNPLQGIMTIIKGIGRRAELDNEETQLLDMAITECNRMKNLIKDLQDFNRPTSGKFAPMDIHAAIDSVLILTKKELMIRKIHVAKNYLASQSQIRAVADQIKQILLNLISNAADACENGGTITITSETDGTHIILHIADDGIGIAPDDANHIFEPFFTTKSDKKGTGLGLPISDGIIKQHGGSIKVKSEPGNGSIFTITLPIKGEHNAEIDSTG